MNATALSSPAPPPRSARRNFWCLSLEGGAYMGGKAFINADTILPTLVSRLGGSPWLVALTPALMMIGFMLPQLFTAHWIERLDRMKPVLRITGVFQRVPVLLAALALWFVGDRAPDLTLLAVVATPLLVGLAGGSTLTAFYELMARVVPPERVPAVNAMRNLFAAGIGLAAGPIIAWVLSRHPGMEGFAILFGIAFTGVMVSYCFFLAIREPDVHLPPRQRTGGLLANLTGLGRLFREQPAFGRYVVVRLLSQGIFVLAPFLAIFALDVLEKGDSFLGQLVAFTMAGAIAGNLGTTAIGHRVPSRSLLGASNFILILVPAGALLAFHLASPNLFAACFFFLGFGRAIQDVALVALSLELFVGPRRPTCLAWMSTLAMVGLVAVSALGGWLHAGPAPLLTAALVTMATQVAGLLLVTGLKPAGT